MKIEVITLIKVNFVLNSNLVIKFDRSGFSTIVYNVHSKLCNNDFFIDKCQGGI